MQLELPQQSPPSIINHQLQVLKVRWQQSLQQQLQQQQLKVNLTNFEYLNKIKFKFPGGATTVKGAVTAQPTTVKGAVVTTKPTVKGAATTTVPKVKGRIGTTIKGSRMARA